MSFLGRPSWPSWPSWPFPWGRRPDMQGRLDWGYGIQLSNNVKKRVDSDNKLSKKPVDSQRLKNYVKIYQTPQLCLEKRDLSPSCVSANATGFRLSCFTPVLREALGLWENMGQKPLILAIFTVMYMMIHAYPLYYIYVYTYIFFKIYIFLKRKHNL